MAGHQFAGGEQLQGTFAPLVFLSFLWGWGFYCCCFLLIKLPLSQSKSFLAFPVISTRVEPQQTQMEFQCPSATERN